MNRKEKLAPSKAFKKVIENFLDNIAKENEKEFGKNGKLDCCKLNKNK